MLVKRFVEQFYGEDEYNTVERRAFARLVYPSRNRPKFKVNKQELDVIDISEKGIKFQKDKQTEIDECVHGTVELLNGKSIDVTGIIVWESEDEVGLLITKIPKTVILEEKQALLGGTVEIYPPKK
jgi:hypothetical protein